MQELMYRTLVVKRPKWVYGMYPLLLIALFVTIQWSKAGWGMRLLYTLLFLMLGFSWFYFTLSLSKRLPAQGKMMIGQSRIELYQYPENGKFQENAMHQSFTEKKLVRIRHGYYQSDDYHYMLFEINKGKNLTVISYAAIFLKASEYEQALDLLKHQTGVKLEKEKKAE